MMMLVVPQRNAYGLTSLQERVGVRLNSSIK